MRRQTAVLCALSLVALTGCPEEFGIEGRVNKAVHKDVQELLLQHCSFEEYKAVCDGDKKQSKECRDKCGG